MSKYETVLRTPELGPGGLKEVAAHGRRLVLANVGQTYYALDAECPEDGTNLAREGRLEGDLLVCPRDHASFDVRDGRRADRRGRALRRYPLVVSGNDVQVGSTAETQ